MTGQAALGLDTGPEVQPYRVVYADPPWRYAAWSGDIGMRTAESFYPTLSTAALKRLWHEPGRFSLGELWPEQRRMIEDAGRLPEFFGGVPGIGGLRGLPVAADAALLMWATAPVLPEALAVMQAWGFAYKTIAFVWVKTTKQPGGYAVGLGHYTRSNAEVVLLGTRGKPERLSHAVRQIIAEPRGEHSRKPDEAYRRIEALFAGPYIELFARRAREGWAAWGNEASGTG